VGGEVRDKRVGVGEGGGEGEGERGGERERGRGRERGRERREKRRSINNDSITAVSMQRNTPMSCLWLS